jgi:hypothetical protein
MMIAGLHLSDSVVLDYALMGNCHVQQIEVYSSAVVGQSNGHVPPEELDYVLAKLLCGSATASGGYRT